ncbi:MAG: hypothetical protein WC979_09245 [Candidatus Pacearchaeota archaeon]|jgi:hypothetical protein
MPRTITTYAEAEYKSCCEEIKSVDEKVLMISNEGQYCISLVPRWSNWGSTLEDGTKLQIGKVYKITIEVED